MGRTVPFLVADRTPRHRRIEPADGVRSTELLGITDVLLGTADLAATVDKLERFFDCRPPTTETTSGLGEEVTMARFSDIPVTICEPVEDTSWLGRRTSELGSLPCGFLLGSTDPERTANRGPIASRTRLGALPVWWLDLDLEGRLGVRRMSD